MRQMEIGSLCLMYNENIMNKKYRVMSFKLTII